MNEQAQQVLADMLERALSGVDAAVEFSQAQIPDVVEQLLMWHAVKSGAIGLIGISAMALSVALALLIINAKPGKVISDNGRFGRKEHEPTIFYDRDGDSNGMQAVAMVLILPFAGGFLASWELMTLAQIIIAPKFYLLEYAAGLVK